MNFMQPQYFKPFSWLLMKYYPERCSAAEAARLYSNIKYWWLQNMNIINWFCALAGLNFVTEFLTEQKNWQKVQSILFHDFNLKLLNYQGRPFLCFWWIHYLFSATIAGCTKLKIAPIIVAPIRRLILSIQYT